MRKLTPLKITIFFTIFGLCWIFFTDLLVFTLTEDTAVSTKFSMGKGSAFILLTALFLYNLIRVYGKQRDQSEAELQKSESRYRAIVENQAEFICRYLPGGILTFVNDTICRYANMRPDDLLGKSYYPFMHEDDREAFVRKIESLDINNRVMVAEARVALPDGRVTWHQWTHHALFDNLGNFVEYQCTGRDITEQRKTEAALRDSEERFKGVVENIGIGIAVISPDMEILSLNSKMEKWFPDPNVTDKPICYKTFNNPPGDSVCSYCPTVLTLKDGEVHETSTDMPAGDETIHYRVISSPIKDKTGKVIAAIEMVEDITERRRVEETQRHSERLLKAIIDTEPECVKLIDINGNLIMMNRAGLNMLQADSLDQVKGQCVCPLITSDYRESFMELTARVFKGESGTLTFEMIGLHGRHLWLETHVVPFRNERDEIIAMLGITRDISEKKKLEEDLLRAQKLESLGVLAGGIAHDFNNLLQGIFGYLQMAKMSLDNKGKAFAMLEQAEKALNMSVNLTSQLLTFSKGGKPVKKSIALQPVIENAAKFALSGSHSNFLITADKDLWHLDADEGQIGQVIQNIVQNANDAMPEGGTVYISAENVDSPGGSIPLLPEGGRFVKMVIKDSGIGIPVQYQLKIFDPYFTTKQKGSGLGLATSYSIVRNHGGVIEVTSELGKGSTFSIYLPAPDTEKIEETQPPASVTMRRGRILVMDDEELIRSIAREMIEAIGHEVICAEDGNDAIKKFGQARESGKPFDVVILDLTVKGGGMGGEQAILKLLEIDPCVKAVVSSGYSDNPVMSDYRTHGFEAFLNKPYRIEALRDCLNALMS